MKLNTGLLTAFVVFAVFVVPSNMFAQDQDPPPCCNHHAIVASGPAVIQSSSEGSRCAHFQGNARFFVACWLLRMTVSTSFSAACEGTHPPCPAKDMGKDQPPGEGSCCFGRATAR